MPEARVRAAYPLAVLHPLTWARKVASARSSSGERLAGGGSPPPPPLVTVLDGVDADDDEREGGDSLPASDTAITSSSVALLCTADDTHSCLHNTALFPGKSLFYIQPKSSSKEFVKSWRECGSQGFFSCDGETKLETCGKHTKRACQDGSKH